MTDREAFEAWIKSARPGTSLRKTDGMYMYTDASLAWKAWQAATAAERERCIDIIETYRVPVGNSRLGELMAELTMDALRSIRDAIRKGKA